MERRHLTREGQMRAIELLERSESQKLVAENGISIKTDL